MYAFGILVPAQTSRTGTWVVVVQVRLSRTCIEATVITLELCTRWPLLHLSTLNAVQARMIYLLDAVDSRNRMVFLPYAPLLAQASSAPLLLWGYTHTERRTGISL